MNPTAQIQVAYVNPVKPGKKMGSVKTADGVYYNVQPAMLSQFQQGGAYNVEFTEKDKADGSGETWKTIQKVIGNFGPKTNGNTTAPLPRQRTNPVDSEQIYTTALLKAFIGAGQIQLRVTEIASATSAIRQAYRQTFGGLEAQRNDTDIGDEISF